MSSTDSKDLPASGDLKIDQEGFVTPAKAISLPGLSLGIWVATLIFYRILVEMDFCPKYTAFCFFTSLVFSVGGSFLAVNKMKLQASTGSKLFLVLMNTFVIYTSANGIQAGNSFLSNSEPGEVCQKASLIPLLTAASWLPDKDSRQTIASQAENQTALRDSFNNINARYEDLIDASKSSRGLVTSLQNRTDSLQKLLDMSQRSNQLWDSLKRQWASAPDKDLKILFSEISRSGQNLNSSKAFVLNLADSIAGAGFYRQLFAQ